MAQEIMKSELDLFKKLTFQGSIENSQFVQYRPVSSLSESSTIEFDIPISPEEYLDLQNVYLWIKGKVVQQNGTDFPAAQAGSPCSPGRPGPYGAACSFDRLQHRRCSQLLRSTPRGH